MKLKVDENGNVVVVDGKPVYTHDDGKEIPFDGAMAFDKIKELNGENKSWREKYEASNTALNLFGELDPEVAKKNAETIANLDDKKLVDANDMEVLKKNLSESYEENLTSTKTSYQKKIDEMQVNLDMQTGNIDELLILGAFERSEFLREKTYLTPDIAYAGFKKGLQVEYTNEGKPHVVGYVNSEKLFSRKDPGKLASPEEAIEMIINAYPQKDDILKGRQGGGSGGGPGSGASDSGDLQAQYNAAVKAQDVNKMITLKRMISQA